MANVSVSSSDFSEAAVQETSRGVQEGGCVLSQTVFVTEQMLSSDCII